MLNGKPYAGNQHVRFEEGKDALPARSRRGALLYKTLLMLMLPLVAFADASTPPSTLVDLTTNGSKPTGSVSSGDYSTTYNANQYNGTKAFDGVENKQSGNRWLAKKANANNMWVTYTFNVATVVDAIRIYLPSGDGYKPSDRAPKAWTFEGSNDKSTWTIFHRNEHGTH